MRSRLRRLTEALTDEKSRRAFLADRDRAVARTCAVMAIRTLGGEFHDGHVVGGPYQGYAEAAVVAAFRGHSINVAIKLLENQNTEGGER